MNSHRASLYKSRPLRKQTSVMREETENKRTDVRLTLMMKRRNILVPISPDNSSVVKDVPDKVKVKSSSQRIREKLMLYKEEKKKRLEREKASSKAIFKVGHVQHPFTTDYEKLYKEIKGKPIVQPINQETYKLAPSSSYKFKPPANIKPLNFEKTSKMPKVKKMLDFNLKNHEESDFNKIKPSPVRTDRRMTRSSAKFPSTPNKQEKSTNNNLEPKKLNIATSSTEKTPDVNKNVPVAYISPFVTISRGKVAARKEYHTRRSSVNNSVSSPKATGDYFSKLMETEIKRLKDLCSEWSTYETLIKPPEEACDMIHVAIGQTELLLKKKFKKFEELIGLSELPNAEQKVTCYDLHAFWDIVSMQVNTLDKRFENLDKLKMNNWEEVLPTPVLKKTKKTKTKVKKTESKSTLTDLIKEARKKNKIQNNGSPLITITNINSKSQPTTPKNTIESKTPKSILKSEKRRSSRVRAKSVIFVDDDKENEVFQSSPLTSYTKEPRRSSRIANRKIKSVS